MTVEIKGLGTITACEDALNYLVILAREASKSFERRNRNFDAEDSKEIANSIYKELKNSGFYEGVE